MWTSNTTKIGSKSVTINTSTNGYWSLEINDGYDPPSFSKEEVKQLIRILNGVEL